MNTLLKLKKTNILLNLIICFFIFGCNPFAKNSQININQVFVLSNSDMTTSTDGTSMMSLHVEDQSGNLSSEYNGYVNVNCQQTEVVCPNSVYVSNGHASFPVKFIKSGTHSISTTDGTITGSTNLNVHAGLASQFVLSSVPASTTAGDSFNFIVTAKDAQGNIVTDYNGTVSITSSDSQAVLPVSAVLINGVGTFSTSLKIAGSQSLTASDGIISANSSSVNVNSNVASQFILGTIPSTVVAGSSVGYTITAKDIYGNIVTGYNGSASVSSTDPQAVLNGPINFSNGVSTDTIILKTAGSQTFTINDGSISIASNQLNVHAGLASQFVLSSVPASTTAGDSFNFIVTAKDAQGNIVTDYNGTVSITSSDSQAVLPVSAVLINGVGTFSTSLKIAGSQSLTASDGIISANSSSVNVNSNVASQFILGTIPSTVVAGSSVGYTITAKDIYGNIVTGYNGSASVSSTDPQAVLNGPINFSNGVSTDTIILKTAGSQTFTINDGSISIASNQLNVHAGLASQFVLSSVPASTTAGDSFNFIVTAKDAQGNIVTDYNGTVSITSSDSQAVLPVSAVLINGVGTFSTSLKTAGSQSLTASDGIILNSNSITVLPGALSTLSILSGNNQTGSTNYTGAVLVKPLVVKAVDIYGNGISGVNVTWTITSGGGQFLESTTTSLSDANGLATRNLMLGKVVGVNTVQATIASPASTVIFSSTASNAIFQYPTDRVEMFTGRSTNSISPFDLQSGITGYTYSIVDGVVPAGLVFNGSTGVISGTPTAAVDTNLKICAYKASVIQGGCNTLTINVYNEKNISGPLVVASNLCSSLSGTGTNSDPILLSTANDINTCVRNYPDRAFKLNADIDFNGFIFLPIPTFSGIFDGNSHSISNWIYSGTGDAAFFLELKNGGIIKSLIMQNISVNTTGSVAALAANISGAFIYDITLDTISVSTSINTSNFGGLVALINNVPASNKFRGFIDYINASNISTHGVAGYWSHSGLIIGMTFAPVRISRIKVIGTNSLTGGNDLGGVMGANFAHQWAGSLFGNLWVDSVSVTGLSFYSNAISGGILGHVESGDSLTNSFSTAIVSGSWSSGIVGYGTDFPRPSYFNIVNTYFRGTVGVDSIIAGDSFISSSHNFIQTRTLSATSAASAISSTNVVLTDSQFKDPANFSTWLAPWIFSMGSYPALGF